MDADYISTAHVNTLKDDGSSREQRRGSNKQRSGPRKTWTIVEEEALVNGLKSLITTGWKCENGFRNGYLAQLEVYMKRLFPQCHIKAEPHTNSKLHVWKKQYSMLTSMMNKSRFGWDESRNMVTVEHENVWQDFVKMYPSSQGMRFKSWLFFPAWKEIFGMDHASGDRSWDPTGAGVEKTQREPPEIQQFNAGTGDWNPDIGFDGINEETPLSQYLNCDPTVNSSSATKRTPGSRKHKSYEPCPKIPQLVSMVSNFCETTNNRIGSLTSVLENEFGDPDKRGVVMAAVRELSGLEENDVIVVTSKLVHDPKDMDIFFSLTKESKEKMVGLIFDGRI